LETIENSSVGNAFESIALPGRIAAQGVARAAGHCTSDGVLSRSFGVTSVTKAATGRYLIDHNLASGYTGSASVTDSTNNPGYAKFRTIAANQASVWTFNANGDLADISFSFQLF
jgi:hypothetical protein